MDTNVSESNYIRNKKSDESQKIFLRLKYDSKKILK